MFNIVKKKRDMKKVICWWSGGVTSAVACRVAIDLFGLDRCEFIMLDTRNEDDDTYRFKGDCEKWYGKEIKSFTREGYNSIEDVWDRYSSLNVAHGAICSTVLKRELREKIQKDIDYEYQVFGFEFDKSEFNRAKSLSLQHRDARGIYPLLMFGYDKKRCLDIVQEAGIEVPRAYMLGYQNNNCLKTKCVQGGVGYWQKVKEEDPVAFYAMAEREHRYTGIKGKPVTMLKDQSKVAKDSGNTLVFLVKHPDYPENKCIDDFPRMKVEPLMECNGFCGVNDLNERSKTEGQLNLSLDF